MTAERVAGLRRLGLRALVAGLLVAALAAIVALLQGSFDDTEVRVVFTSLGLSTFGSLGAIVASTQASSSRLVRRIGLAASVLAGLAFVLFLPALWIDDAPEGIWRAFGCAAVGAVATAHAAVVLRARRPSDGPLIARIVVVSVVLGALDGLGALLAISGFADGLDGGAAQAFAVSLVLLVLTTALVPLLRRLQSEPESPTGARSAGSDGVPIGSVSTAPNAPLATEMVAIADRIDELAADPAIRTPEIRREVVRLRRLARSIDP